MTHHASAVKFWKRLLYAATAVSVVCNSAHAMLEKHTGVLGIGVAGVLAALPPLVFFFIVEGIAKAVKSGIGGVSYVIGLLFAAALGAGAFVISFNSLYMFARDWGVFDEHLVFIFPALVDAVMALSTYMLLAMGNKPTKRAKKAKETVVGDHAIARVGLIPKLRIRLFGGAATVPTLPTTAHRQVIDTPLSTPERQPDDTTATPEPVIDRVSSTPLPTPAVVAETVADAAVADDIDAEDLAFAVMVRARAKVKSSPAEVHRVIEMLRATDGNLSAAASAAGMKSRDPARRIRDALAEMEAEPLALTAVG